PLDLGRHPRPIVSDLHPGSVLRLARPNRYRAIIRDGMERIDHEIDQRAHDIARTTRERRGVPEIFMDPVGRTSQRSSGGASFANKVIEVDLLRRRLVVSSAANAEVIDELGPA